MNLALETIRVLRRFKNAVLEGPPGTGKSYVIGEIAVIWQKQTGRQLRGDARGRYAITLHPNSTYEEFVEGLRYDEGQQGFVRKDGFIQNVISDARANPEGDYLVLIDELNRANVPKVFGDLLLTMEASKRSTWDGSDWVGGMEVTLPYSGSLFSIPSNVFLLGTMNTSDRSIAPLDSALRRRFGFIRVETLSGSDLRDAIIARDGLGAADRVARSVEELANLNEALRQCLGPNAMLGHSYLFGADVTQGAVADANDPLARLRSAAQARDVVGVLWLEVGGMWGGNHNQLDLPDTTRSRQGLVDEFYPMTSEGVTRNERSGLGTQDVLDITLAGQRFFGNTIEYNSGGSNVRLKYQGRTSVGDGIQVASPASGLEQLIHAWLRRGDNSFELILLPRNSTVLAALRSVSVAPTGWHATTAGASGRTYGVVDLAALSASEPSDPTAAEDAEWMIWRYAMLPQLVDTVTQVGATDLLAQRTRSAWLESAGVSDVSDRWAKFDRFLASLLLAIEEEGYGITRGLTVVDIPAGAINEYVPKPEDDGDGGEPHLIADGDVVDDE